MSKVECYDSAATWCYLGPAPGGEWWYLVCFGYHHSIVIHTHPSQEGADRNGAVMLVNSRMSSVIKNLTC